MGTLLDKAMLAAKQRPADEQDEIARIVLAIIGDEAPPVALSEDDIATLKLSLDQAARGEFAGDAAVAEVWRKHGL